MVSRFIYAVLLTVLPVATPASVGGGGGGAHDLLAAPPSPLYVSPTPEISSPPHFAVRSRTARDAASTSVSCGVPWGRSFAFADWMYDGGCIADDVSPFTLTMNSLLSSEAKLKCNNDAKTRWNRRVSSRCTARCKRGMRPATVHSVNSLPVAHLLTPTHFLNSL